MRKLLFFLICAFALPIAAQVPEVIPDDYSRKYKRLERRIDRWAEKKDTYDIRLHPIEQLPITPASYALADGNWANDYLGVNQMYSDLQERVNDPNNEVRPVTVYVFDTGNDYAHPLLKNLPGVDEGRDLVGGGTGDKHGHSTHVAGIYAALSPDQPLGIARVLVEAGLLEIIPYRVLDDRGFGSYTTTRRAVLIANMEAKKKIEEGRFVIYNFSLGGGGFYAPLADALQAAEDLGVCIPVAASGNTGKKGVQHPANAPAALATAALSRTATGVELASYSTYGPEVWAAAPGSSILSTWPPDLLRLASGTSMATPTLGATFALMAAVFPDATAEQLKAHFRQNVTDLGADGKDDLYGYGVGLLSNLLKDAPGDEPDEPDEPGDDPDEPEERPVAYSPTFQFDGPFRLRWRHHNYDDQAAITDGDYTILEEQVVGESTIGGTLRTLEITRVDITVNDTKVPEKKQWRELSLEVGRYLRGIAISAPDFMGPADITFWAAWFLDRHLTRKFGEDFTIELIQATGDGDSRREPPMYAYRKDGLKPYTE